MWCETCQQDLPGIASMEDEQLIWCARCNRLMTGLAEVDQTAGHYDGLKATSSEASWLDSPMAIGLDYIAPPEMPKDSHLEVPLSANDLLAKAKHVCLPTVGLHAVRRQRRLLLTGWSCMALGAAAQLISAAMIGWRLWRADELPGSAEVMLLILGPLLLVTGFFFYLDHVCRRQRAAELSLRQLISQGTDLQEVIGRLTTERTAVEFFEVEESSLDRSQQSAEEDSDQLQRAFHEDFKRPAA